MINCHNNSAHILDHRLLYWEIIQYMYIYTKNKYIYIYIFLMSLIYQSYLSSSPINVHLCLKPSLYLSSNCKHQTFQTPTWRGTTASWNRPPSTWLEKIGKVFSSISGFGWLAGSNFARFRQDLSKNFEVVMGRFGENFVEKFKVWSIKFNLPMHPWDWYIYLHLPYKIN